MLKTVSRFVRRLSHGEPLIVVSGLPRSGTSMAMKMLEAGGVSLVEDSIRTADEDNPRGYYEDERVKDLAQMNDKSWLREARGKGIKIISHLLRELPTDNNYKVLFIRRSLDEVLASQAKMLVRRGEETTTDDTTMRELFEGDLWRALYQLKRGPHFEFLELEHRAFLDDPKTQAEKIRDFLAMDLDVEAMAAVVDRSLHRNRAEDLSGGTEA